MSSLAMRIGAIAICTAAAIVVGSAQQTRDNAEVAAGTAGIAGVVTAEGAAPNPIRRARVVLQPWTRRGGRTVVTDDAGRFAFKNLAPERYRISAYKDPYLTTQYGARRPGGLGTEIAVAAGQQVTIAIAMPRGAVVSGAIYDAAGRPAPGVMVTPMRFTYDAALGTPTLRRGGRGDSRTDDLGAYRFWGLDPGQYVVMAQAPLPAGGRGGPAASEVRRMSTEDLQLAIALLSSASALPPGGGKSPVAALPQGEPVTYAPVFYPSVTDLSQTPFLRLQAGEERTGVDLVLRRVATARVRGTISGLTGGDPRTFAITVTPGGAQAEMLGTLFESLPGITRPDASGGFTIAGLAPGQYVVTAKLPPPVPGAATDPLAQTWASADVTIVEGGEQNVVLQARPAIRISGRLVYEGSSPKPASSAGITYRLLPIGSGGNLGAGPGISVNADGTFTVDIIAPGRYRLLRMVNSAAEATSYHLANAIANGRDALDFGLDVRTESIEWTWTMRDKSASIEGTLQSAAGIAAPDYSIVIFTTDSTYWVPGARRVTAVRPATDGKYMSTMLPPGDYYIAALTDVEPGEWHSRGFLEQLVGSAIKVRLEDGQKLVQDIRIR